MSTKQRSFIKIHKIKLTLPVEEADFLRWYKYQDFKKWVQEQVPELTINSIVLVECPWWRNPWVSIDYLFKKCFKKFRIEIMTFALATKAITLVVHHRAAIDMFGKMKKETMNPYYELDLTPLRSNDLGMSGFLGDF